MKKRCRFLGKVLAALLLIPVLAVLLTAFSPIYRFREPAPFVGPDIFNPYRDIDSARSALSLRSSKNCWKRTLLHTHTRVKGPFPMNECDYSPQ